MNINIHRSWDIKTCKFLCLSLKSEGDLMPIGSQGIGIIELFIKEAR
jgi:hypothetical protein